MTWRPLVLQHGSSFIDWLNASNARLKALSNLANKLETFLIGGLQSPQDCVSFWNVIPLIRAACNFNETYELPLAVEAYAYVHLLDRYWRTWDALIELTKKGALPAGTEGVRVLDVGTGPAPTPYAIQDYYSLLREYGQEKEIFELTKQETHFSIVESSASMRRFMHLFSEHCLRPGPFGADITDFVKINPSLERKELQRHLRNEEYYDASDDEYYSEYSLEEANTIAQKHQRYRIVVFSNFFTVSQTLQKYEPTLNILLSDLNGGATVLVLGARGNQYEEIYRRLNELGEQNGLIKLIILREILGNSPQINEAQTEIKRCQHAIFQHLEQVVGVDNLPESVKLMNYQHRRFAERMRIELPSTIRWPDYRNPMPDPAKRVKFSLNVYRKGKWPR